MIVVTDKSKCNGCHACYNACPKHCIEMKADNLGFLYPVVNEVECVNCNICEKVCPILSDRTKNTHALQIGYAAYNSDEAIRLESSSGGVFTLLAEYILQNGGIVIGASMKEDNKGVHHIVVDNINDLEKLRTSKYVQSEIGNTYKKAQNALKNGKLVLFTGTPCQIGGLYSYLGQDYDNLYTQDLICHGVPSPYIWKKYVEMRETQFAAKLRRTNFRHKKYGWNSFALLLEFSNNKAYEEINPKDLFLRGFLTNLYLRKAVMTVNSKPVTDKLILLLLIFGASEDLFLNLMIRKEHRLYGYIPIKEYSYLIKSRIRWYIKRFLLIPH